MRLLVLTLLFAEFSAVSATIVAIHSAKRFSAFNLIEQLNDQPFSSSMVRSLSDEFSTARHSFLSIALANK